MKKLAKKIDPSILLAFHNLLDAIQTGRIVLLLEHTDICAYAAMDAYLHELRGDERTDKKYRKTIQSLHEEFEMQRLASITYGRAHK